MRLACPHTGGIGGGEEGVDSNLSRSATPQREHAGEKVLWQPSVGRQPNGGDAVACLRRPNRSGFVHGFVYQNAV
jgi:hypothetical protein